jgi:hypothetical protein
MSDRDEKGLNEAVAELTEDVLHRAGRLFKSVACLGKPLLQRRPRLNGTAMLKRNAELVAEACNRFTMHGRSPRAFLT